MCDAHDEEIEELVAHFKSRDLLPLVDQASLAQTIGVSTQLIFSIIKHKKSHYRQFVIEKSGRGIRIISSPRTYLKAIQWWLLDNIFRKLDFPENVTGFIRGRGIQMNAEFHIGANHILNMDLKDFFPSVCVEQVFSIFQSLGYNEVVAKQLSEICTLDGCLPQGAPTSPSLANIAASELYNLLIEYSLPIRLTPMTATCRVPPLSRVKLGIGWSRGVARDAEQ